MPRSRDEMSRRPSGWNSVPEGSASPNRAPARDNRPRAAPGVTAANPRSTNPDPRAARAPVDAAPNIGSPRRVPARALKPRGSFPIPVEEAVSAPGKRFVPLSLRFPTANRSSRNAGHASTETRPSPGAAHAPRITPSTDSGHRLDRPRRPPNRVGIAPPREARRTAMRIRPPTPADAASACRTRRSSWIWIRSVARTLRGGGISAPR